MERDAAAANDADETSDHPFPASTIKSIFTDACELPADQREPLLQARCANDPDLRLRVDALLEAHDRAGAFLADPSRFAAVPASITGKMIGPYKLLQPIGEGGFGVVYLAEQERPVRRRVALKIIKLGMDTKAVIGRFEAERQALAMMDHPNIARIFDAGATDAGRPYFVMELVRGIPLTHFCDQAKISLNDRLLLFMQICQAVQHAHQKGIIHRDIKPTNILVTHQDGAPLAKVIDFGVAKAIDQRLTEQTLFTDFQQMIGTPTYMSPEQAGGGLDIDTRSDVYSLGVLLYELLTGTTPFDARQLRATAYAEMQRIIREVDPPRPSTRLSTLGKTLQDVATQRCSEPNKLGQLVRGDLDWIVMKALEKNRARRYASAGDLAADVSRYLHTEVVAASPPGKLYKLSKFLRRNKALAAAVAAIALTLIVATIASLVMYDRERAARNQADIARLHEQALREQSERNYALALDAVDHLTNIAQNRLTDSSHLADVRRDMLEDAAKFYETFVQEHREDSSALLAAAQAHERAAGLRYVIGQPHEAETHLLQAIDLLQSLSNTHSGEMRFPYELEEGYMQLGRLYLYELNDYPAAERCFRQVKNFYSPLCAASPNDKDTNMRLTWACHELARSLMASDRNAEAVPELIQTIEIRQRFADYSDEGDVLAVGQAHHYLGDCYARIGDYTNAETHFRKSLAILAPMHAAHPDHDWLTYCYTNVEAYFGGMLLWMDRTPEAEKLIRAALADMIPLANRTSEYNLNVTHVATLYENLGNILLAEHRNAEAHDAYVISRDMLRRIYDAHPDAPARAQAALYPLVLCPDKSIRDPAAAVIIARAVLNHAPKVQDIYSYLGVALYQVDDFDNAIRAFSKAQESGPKDLGFARYYLAAAQFRAGQLDAARLSLQRADEWAARTPLRWREPRSFAPEARRLILGPNAASQPHE